MGTVRFSRRWVPAIVAPIVVAAGVVITPALANAAAVPPQKTAAQVLDLIAAGQDAHYSGTVRQSSDLGLPQLPDSTTSTVPGGTSAAGLLELATGSHSARVYVDGATRQRVQVLDTLSERDVIRNGTTVWTYDAQQRTATHATLDVGAHDLPLPTTPADAADRLIAAITPTTSVSVTRSTDLGRGVYELRLTPKTSATLVADAVITVDANTGVPLAARIDARGQSTPAVQVAFSSIDFAQPAADIFSFTPPKGTTVTDRTLTRPTGHTSTEHKGVKSPPHATMPKPTVIGTGWASVIEVPGRGAMSALGGDAALLNELTRPVAGGRMLQTSLITVYLRGDGTVFAGAVPSSALLSAAQ
ncbi:LolA family protein [Microbacterium terrisoli]|uniref:LolA family protein n=1 Tax=Microbacterium terrisoli TaxID=3242192 RepID=UPI0028048CAE|nr:DUF2092 domain-containing protein [Microbacterium protaetiae]